ncbi:MAG: YjfB family protein [Lachnospiraceae bacterium]|nr:YjfB family protein [Lachnospiraceae bacterium]MBP5414640.1 YjfB family protein [Lachnospiraceae bacterium]MBP5745106.1 YjfB family protein [Lachnospiraceae bacterium]MBR6148215.1 YjfB family protein [Lachnospiraceae bacterium]MCR4866136.1 YjfB family protein [Lachnospiraceae bacterium]
MTISNIGTAAMAVTGSDSLSKVDIAMLSKALDTNEAAGNGLLKMIDAAAMERSVNPSVGSNFDMVV